MLITCFQCRQQLDVPDDSAGKRVHCPHCQHVIVVPAKLTEAPQTPVTAMPIMELEEESGGQAAKSTAKTPTANVPPSYPLPPLHPSAQAPEKAKPPNEDLPSFPPIDRSPRRRAPASAPAPKVRWGASIVVGALAGIVAFVALLGLLSSNGFFKQRRFDARHQAFNPPPQAPIFIPPIPQQPFNPFIPNPALNKPPQEFPHWQAFVNVGHRFKVHFPGPPQQRQGTLNFLPMTVFEGRIGEWDFSVAHRRLSEKEHRAMPLAQRFSALIDDLCVRLNGFRQNNNELPVKLKGVYPGREWTISLVDGARVFASAYSVEDGGAHHLYVLTARGPNFADRHDVDIEHFFDSFDVLFGISTGNKYLGESLYEETDALAPQQGRDHELISLALDPTSPIRFIGTTSSQIKVIWDNGNVAPTSFAVHDHAAVEQLRLSRDGHWLAVAVADEIQLWQPHFVGGWLKVAAIPGRRCAFTLQDHLLVVSEHNIKEFDPAKQKFLHTVEVPDLALEGLALSADHRTLAVYGGKDILLWHWPERKLLGRIEAHDAPITCVTFSADGNTLASGSVDRTIKLWDVGTRAERATLRQHAWTVGCLAFKPDGKYLASAGLDGMLLLWDLQPDSPRLAWAQTNQFPVRVVAWDAKGEQLFYTCKHLGALNQPGGQQATVKLRRLAWADVKPNAAEAEKIVAQRAGLHLATGVGRFFFAGAGQTLVATTESNNNPKQDGQILVWDAATARLKHRTPAKSVGALSPDGKWLVFSSVGFQTDLQLLELATNRVTLGPAHFNGDLPQAWLFTPDSRSVWVLKRNTLERYELPKLIQRQTLQVKEAKDPDPIMIYPALDQQTFLIEKGAGPRRLTLHAIADGKELPMPKFAPGTWSKFLRLRKSNRGWIEVEDILRGASAVVGQQRHIMAAAAIHPDGKIGATEDSANDKVLRINFWDLQKRQPILTLPDTSARTSSGMAFSSDGRLFACTTDGGWTRIVPLDWLRERKNLLPCDGKDVTGP